MKLSDLVQIVGSNWILGVLFRFTFATNAIIATMHH